MALSLRRRIGKFWWDIKIYFAVSGGVGMSNEKISLPQPPNRCAITKNGTSIGRIPQTCSTAHLQWSLTDWKEVEAVPAGSHYVYKARTLANRLCASGAPGPQNVVFDTDSNLRTFNSPPNSVLAFTEHSTEKVHGLSAAYLGATREGMFIRKWGFACSTFSWNGRYAAK
jgi:hypothetical protein